MFFVEKPAGNLIGPGKDGGTGITSEQSIRFVVDCPSTWSFAMAALNWVIMLCWLSAAVFSMLNTQVLLCEILHLLTNPCHAQAVRESWAMVESLCRRISPWIADSTSPACEPLPEKSVPRRRTSRKTFATRYCATSCSPFPTLTMGIQGFNLHRCSRESDHFHADPKFVSLEHIFSPQMGFLTRFEFKVTPATVSARMRRFL